MDAIVAALIQAGIPLISQLLQLGGLFVKAKTQGLTLPEVEAGITKITKRSGQLDDEENRAAGLT